MSSSKRKFDSLEHGTVTAECVDDTSLHSDTEVTTSTPISVLNRKTNRCQKPDLNDVNESVLDSSMSPEMPCLDTDNGDVDPVCKPVPAKRGRKAKALKPLSDISVVDSSIDECRSSKRIRKEKSWEDFSVTGSKKHSQKADCKNGAGRRSGNMLGTMGGGKDLSQGCDFALEKEGQSDFGTSGSSIAFYPIMSLDESCLVARELPKAVMVEASEQVPEKKKRGRKPKSSTLENGPLAKSVAQSKNTALTDVESLLVDDKTNVLEQNLVLEKENLKESKPVCFGKKLPESVNEFSDVPDVSKPVDNETSNETSNSSKVIRRQQSFAVQSICVSSCSKNMNPQTSSIGSQDQARLGITSVVADEKDLCSVGSEKLPKRTRKSTTAFLQDYDCSRTSHERHSKSNVASSDTDQYEVTCSPVRTKPTGSGKKSLSRVLVNDEHVKGNIIGSDTDEYEPIADDTSHSVSVRSQGRCQRSNAKESRVQYFDSNSDTDERKSFGVAIGRGRGRGRGRPPGRHSNVHKRLMRDSINNSRADRTPSGRVGGKDRQSNVNKRVLRDSVSNSDTDEPLAAGRTSTGHARGRGRPPGRHSNNVKKRVILDSASNSDTDGPATSDRLPIGSARGRGRHSSVGKHSQQNSACSSDADVSFNEIRVGRTGRARWRGRGRGISLNASRSLQPDSAIDSGTDEAEAMPISQTGRGRGRGRGKGRGKGCGSGDVSIVSSHHIEQNNKEILKCMHCVEEFISIDKLKYHLSLAHHSILTDSMKSEFNPKLAFEKLDYLLCLICSKQFNSYQSFNYHSNWCNQQNKTIHCDFCICEVSSYEFGKHLNSHKERNSLQVHGVVKQSTKKKLRQVHSDAEDGNQNSQPMRGEVEQIEEPEVGATGRIRRTAAKKAMTLLQQIIGTVDGEKTNSVSPPQYTCGSEFPDSFLVQCRAHLKQFGELACCYEDCQTTFNDVKIFTSHLFECSLRAKFLDRDSTDFVCLVCGRQMQLESSMQQHMVEHSKPKDREIIEDDDSSAKSINAEDESEETDTSSSSSFEEEEEAQDNDTMSKSFRGRKTKEYEFDELCFTKFLKFTKRMSRSNLYANWKPSVKSLSMIELCDVQRYIPENQRQSFVIQTSAKTFSDLPMMDVFDSHSNGSTLNINVGGPIWSLAWCPVETGQRVRQYIAVYAHHTAKDTHIIDEPTNHDILLQIYDCGFLSTRPSSTKPELVLGLVLDCGPIWDMKWCPTGTWEAADDFGSNPEILPRLGLLAVASHNGKVLILSVPHRLVSASSPFYRITPRAMLTQLSTESSCCLCLDWSWYNGCQIIVGGFADGSLSLWDLETSSSLLRSPSENGTEILRPFATISAHSLATTSVALCQSVPHLLLTCSHDRTVRMWDMRDMQSPIFSQHSRVAVWSGAVDAKGDQMEDDMNKVDSSGATKGSRSTSALYTGSMKTVYWPIVDYKFGSSCDECYNFKSARVYQYDIKKGITVRQAVVMHHGCIWGTAYSNLMNVVASCDSTGFVVVSGWPRINMKVLEMIRVPMMEAETLKADDATVAVVKLSQSVLETASEETDASKSSSQVDRPITNSRILLKDFSSKWKCPRFARAPVSLPDDPVTSGHDLAAHRVEWNPNLGSHNWLAVGGQAGLLRFLFFQHPKNNFADTQSAKMFARRTNSVEVNCDLTTNSELNFSAATGVEFETDMNSGIELNSESSDILVCLKAETGDLSESLQGPDEILSESMETVIAMRDSSAAVR